MNLKVAIVEDEEVYANHLINMLNSWSASNKVAITIARFDKANSFIQAFSQNGCFDAVFLDIYLGDGNGMEIARQIRKYDPFIPITFITKTNEYVGQGYDVWAMQYLIKPAAYADISQCMDRIMQLRLQKADQTFTFKSEGFVRVIACRDIYYFQSEGHYIEIYTVKGQFRFRENINDLQNQLPEQFIRCNRSTIINIFHLFQYDAKTNYKNVILSNGTTIPVSGTYAKNMKARCFELFL